MSRLDLKLIAFFLIFLAIAAALTYFLLAVYSPPYSYGEFEPTAVQPGSFQGNECTPGKTAACTVQNGCPGSRDCLQGYWSPCIQKKECEPEETRYCSTGGCSGGTQKCNKCSQWGPCTP